MKKIAQLLGVIAVVASSFAFGFKSLDSASPEVLAPATLARHYQSVGDMARDALIVAEVEVLNAPNSFEYQRVLFSTSQVRITRQFKGPRGLSILTILDNGGVYRGKEYGMGGMPLLHKGDRYLLFLERYEGPVVSQEAFVINGVWQGKVRVTTTGALEYVGPKDETEELQRDLLGHNLDTIKTLISTQ